MKLFIAIATLALAVTSTTAISHFKVNCRSVSYAKHYYTTADCSGTGFVIAAFKPDVCENTQAALSEDASAKFAYNATSKVFTQTGYSKADCAGTAKTSPGLLAPSEYKLDTCVKHSTVSYKITAASQAVDYHLSTDDTCSGDPIYMVSGECFVNTKITCASDNKKYHYQLWTDKCASGDGDAADNKDLETGKCIALDSLNGAGTFSVVSSFVIMAFAIMMM